MASGFRGTSMAILAGINGSIAATNYGKPTEKAVNTGWAPPEASLAATSSACGAWQTWEASRPTPLCF
jgi:hypothetical protein